VDGALNDVSFIRLIARAYRRRAHCVLTYPIWRLTVRPGLTRVSNCTQAGNQHNRVGRRRRSNMWMRAFVAAAVAALTIGVGANAAFAGEVTGTGEETAGPANANSICVFSGLNDDPDAPLVVGDFEVAPNGPGGIAQSYGQDVKIVGSELTTVLNPGDACPGGSNLENPAE
jgi:hypothetical protein